MPRGREDSCGDRGFNAQSSGRVDDGAWDNALPVEAVDRSWIVVTEVFKSGDQS